MVVTLPPLLPGLLRGRNALVSHLSQAGFAPQEMIDVNVAVSRGRGQLADRSLRPRDVSHL